jgi:hypothetical protein
MRGNRERFNHSPDSDEDSGSLRLTICCFDYTHYTRVGEVAAEARIQSPEETFRLLQRTLCTFKNNFKYESLYAADLAVGLRLSFLIM